MADDKKKPQDPTADESKNLKKLLEAHVAVAAHRLGRAPTMSDIQDMLNEQPAPASDDSGIAQEVAKDPSLESEKDSDPTPGEPKILSFKVFYGMGDKKGKDGQSARQPDPNKVLFYETPEGGCFDCSQQEWVDRPAILDHLPSRDLQHDEKGQDILRAIASGVVDDDDFEALDKAGLVNDDGKRVFALYKKALDYSGKLAALEKSEDATESVENEAIQPDQLSDAGLVTKQGSDLVASFMETAGVQRSLDQIREETGEEGVDLIAQILEAAFADVDAKTRAIVNEEVTRQIAPLVHSMDSIMQHMGIQSGADSGGDAGDQELTPESLEGEEPDQS